MKRIIRGIKKTAKKGVAPMRKGKVENRIHAELSKINAQLKEVSSGLAGYGEPSEEFLGYYRRGEHHRLHPEYVDFIERRHQLNDEKLQLEARRNTLVIRLDRVENMGRRKTL